jgi:hypothetical protein
LDWDAALVEVDIDPPEGEELAAAGTRGSGQDEEEVEEGSALYGVGEEPRDLGGSGWAHLGGLGDRTVGGRGGIGPDPVPAHGLGEGTVQYGVDATDGAGGEGLGVVAAVGEQPGVEVVDLDGAEVAHDDRAEAGVR